MNETIMRSELVFLSIAYDNFDKKGATNEIDIEIKIE